MVQVLDPRVTSGAYFDWREQLKAYITAPNLDPGHLTDAQVEAITDFARALPPVKDRVTHIKKNHYPDDVVELTRHRRMLVKDSARKLHTSNLGRIAERAGGSDVAESPSK